METPPVPLNMGKRVNMRHSIGNSFCFYENKNTNENIVSEFWTSNYNHVGARHCTVESLSAEAKGSKEANFTVWVANSSTLYRFKKVSELGADATKSW